MAVAKQTNYTWSWIVKTEVDKAPSRREIRCEIHDNGFIKCKHFL